MPEAGHAVGSPIKEVVTLLDQRQNNDFGDVCSLWDASPGHEHLNIGRIKLHSSMTFI
jgi:hypothetical protein